MIDQRSRKTVCVTRYLKPYFKLETRSFELIDRIVCIVTRVDLHSSPIPHVFSILFAINHHTLLLSRDFFYLSHRNQLEIYSTIVLCRSGKPPTHVLDRAAEQLTGSEQCVSLAMLNEANVKIVLIVVDNWPHLFKSLPSPPLSCGFC